MKKFIQTVLKKIKACCFLFEKFDRIFFIELSFTGVETVRVATKINECISSIDNGKVIKASSENVINVLKDEKNYKNIIKKLKSLQLSVILKLHSLLM